ncbi:heparan-sulfate 6-O-sulfotransferase 1-B-like isoform X2 [Saccoglossus kowalevskii]|uniref:Heparan-sulfate 6-O-sulfotransferase n=1 Tax=Saccoglossus kowalevskii TaxID=10224 RepID=A0ABM0GW91_SACKO|nr:PREDICTED: heparan-sulfate 6-O-sulfotransferase 3-like [Saccoglossus kowalevskii]
MSCALCQEGRKLKCFVSMVVLIGAMTVLYYSVCWGPVHETATLQQSDYAHLFLETEQRVKKAKSKTFSEKTLDRDVEFNITGNDVLVFLHVQKTGGTTFGKHLVKDIDLDQPCECHRNKKKCDCYRPGSGNRELWLFSRFSTGWSCGLHADWTELTQCVDGVMDKREGESKKRRYYLITMLRDPVLRYISEWRHVQRGATWKTAVHMCDGRTPTSEELPLCYSGEDWRDVTLQEFLACPYNLASNRQTRMLADLELVGCYNKSAMSEEERDNKMLESAKTNLRRMAFFGLTELQKKSQYLFERTFKLKFEQPFEQYDETLSNNVDIDVNDRNKIRNCNKLDIELYAYAKNLFMQRYKYMAEMYESKEFLEDVENW